MVSTINWNIAKILVRKILQHFMDFFLKLLLLNKCKAASIIHNIHKINTITLKCEFYQNNCCGNLDFILNSGSLI